VVERLSKKPVYNTRMGVAELLDSYRAEQLCLLLQDRYGCEVRTEGDIPVYIREYDENELKKIRHEVDRRLSAIVETSGKIAKYIKFSQFEIKQLATRLAEQSFPTWLEKIKSAELLLGKPIPGFTIESQYGRTCSAAFWRRVLTTSVSRAREHLFLKLGMIGKKKEIYSSNLSLDEREQQLHAQEKWMRTTVLVRDDPVSDEPTSKMREEICLSDVVKRPEQKIAKLYTFLKGMGSLGAQQKLVSAMVTITLEPEWHPNPSDGTKKWNGKSPREAHKSFCKRWQAVMRDLDRIGIKLSGLRVVEPHGDACPHYHLWLLYRPEHEVKILLMLMRYFPLKLKIRSPGASESSNDDIIYDTRNDLAAKASRPSRGKKDIAQVEFSRIVQEVGSGKEGRLCTGASYVMKYLMKTLPESVRRVTDRSKNKVTEESEDIGSENDPSTVEEVYRVDAFRSVWGINQGQLFGVAKCLIIWDELRRMQQPPVHPRLRDLWMYARGSDKQGRIEKYAGQHGDAHAFLEALGGLDAARNGKRKGKHLVIGRLVENGRNRYGEVIKKTMGIQLIERERRKVRKSVTEKWSREFKWKSCTEVIVAIKTKVGKWKFEKKISHIDILDRRGDKRYSSAHH